jgi:hypothetical protein
MIYVFRTEILQNPAFKKGFKNKKIGETFVTELEELEAQLDA